MSPVHQAVCCCGWYLATQRQGEAEEAVEIHLERNPGHIVKWPRCRERVVG